MLIVGPASVSGIERTAKGSSTLIPLTWARVLAQNKAMKIREAAERLHITEKRVYQLIERLDIKPSSQWDDRTGRFLFHLSDEDLERLRARPLGKPGRPRKVPVTQEKVTLDSATQE